MDVSNASPTRHPLVCKKSRFKFTKVHSMFLHCCSETPSTRLTNDKCKSSARERPQKNENQNNSKRVYVEGTKNGVKVPMREITLSPTKSSDGQETENPAIRLYDTSGPWGDSEFHGQHERGLPPLRKHWVLARKDTQIIDGRKSTPADNGYLSDLHAQRSDKRTIGSRKYDVL